MDDTKQRALEIHKKFKGKIETGLKDKVDSMEKLSLYYTPGVGAVSSYVAEHPQEARDYTQINNTVAVISDGSAVLGLGNLGALGALPVMEGKAVLFKSFADVDAVPLVLNTQDPDEIIAVAKAVAPTFGGINLEDIKAPECFVIEEALKKELGIPVFHDDQHGTAVVVLAGLTNALKIKNAKLEDVRIVIAGAGAAGIAIAKLLKKAGATDIVMTDSRGVISGSRTDLNEYKQEVSEWNIRKLSGDLAAALSEADVFIGVAQPGIVDQAMIKSMRKDPIIFAMSNPVPEIMPEEALAAGALVVATGRSDFPNQVNNALAFPGIFRGALDNKVVAITDDHKIAAAEAIASLVAAPTPERIIPDIFHPGLAQAVAQKIV